MISGHTVQLEDDFDISKAMEEYETMEAKIKKCITESLFWKMLYKAISQGSEKGHILCLSTRIKSHDHWASDKGEALLLD